MKFKKEEISLEGLMYIPEIEVLVKAFFNKICPPCVQNGVSELLSMPSYFSPLLTCLCHWTSNSSLY
jgi:hypothetical protein